MGKTKLNFDVRITGNGPRHEILQSIVKFLTWARGRNHESTNKEYRDEFIRAEIWETSSIEEQSLRELGMTRTEDDKPKKGYEPTEEDIEEGFHNREAGYES